MLSFKIPDYLGGNLVNFRFFNVDLVSGLIIIFIIAAIVKYHRLREIGRYVEDKPLHSLITGVLSLLIFIPLVVLFAFAAPGLAVLIGIACVVPMAVGMAVVSFLVGYHLTTRVEILQRFSQNAWQQLVVGYLSITLTQSIPLLGELVNLAVTLLGIGSVIRTRFGRVHSMTMEERG